MAVGRSLLVDGTAQVEITGDGGGAQVERLTHRTGDLLGIDDLGAEGLDHEGHRMGDADGVGHLDLTPCRRPGGDDVLGDPPCGVRRGAVDLQGSLPENAPPPWRAIPP